MGKRNELLTPDFVMSQPGGGSADGSSSSSRPSGKRQRLLANPDEDSSLESADQIARTLVLMRFNRLPMLPTQPEKHIVPDCMHVTDDEEEDDDSEAAPRSPPLALLLKPGELLCCGPPVAMALPRPPLLPRPALAPPLPLEQRQIRAPYYLPEGRPLPPAPTLPSLRTWSTVPAAAPPAAFPSKV